MNLKEKVLDELSAALDDDHLKTFVSFAFSDREGYMPFLISEFGLQSLTREQRRQLAEVMIELAQRIRH